MNRLLSGAAEASASGADEALAYDSLASEGRADEWPAVLERVMRWQSVAFFVTMIIGAAAYDERFVQSILFALRDSLEGGARNGDAVSDLSYTWQRGARSLGRAQSARTARSARVARLEPNNMADDF